MDLSRSLIKSMKKNIEEYYPNGKLMSTVPSENGLRHGKMKLYYETGELKYEGEFLNDKQEGLWNLYYENGDIQRENTFKNHIKISEKEYYKGGNKVKYEGKYDEINQEKIGKWQFYHENGELEKEQIFNKNFSESLKEWDKNGNLISEEKQTGFDVKDNLRSGILKSFFRNGNLKSESTLSNAEFEKGSLNKITSSRWINFRKQGSFKEYYEENKLKSEGQYVNGKKTGKWVSFFLDGKLKKEEIFNNDICESLKEWDQSGKIIKEEVLKNNDIKTILVHEIMTKGNFNFELEDEDCEVCNGEGVDNNDEDCESCEGMGGNYGSEDVFGQEHMLIEKEIIYENGEWFEGDNREEIDSFCLTGYEKGFRYDVNDLYKFFKISEETSYPEWDWNGLSENWCGINEEDNHETAKKKWDNYKSKFPRVTSKTQFEY